MNERIKLLLEQAGVGDNWNPADWYSMSPEMVEKFAELIVQECQRRVDQYINECGEVASMPDTVIKEHFGVKE